MGSFTGTGKLPSELTEKTSLLESDIVITGSAAQRTTWKNVLEKISFSGLATTAKNIIGAINELNTKIKNFNIENSDWTKEYTFTLKQYGQYLLIINKGSAVSLGIVFNFTSSVPQAFWVNTLSNTVTVTGYTNALKVTSSDSTSFWASCINLSVA